MALSNIFGWRNQVEAAASCGSACGAEDKPGKAPAACGAADVPAACGAADAPAACGASEDNVSEGDVGEKPSACGSACGASDK